MGLTKVPLVLAAISSACAPTLSTHGRSVQILSEYPSAECRELGEVTSKASGGISHNDDLARSTRIRNAAGELGANYVKVDGERSNGNFCTNARGDLTLDCPGDLVGTALRCP